MREGPLGREPPLGRVSEESHGLEVATSAQRPRHLDVRFVGLALHDASCVPTDSERSHQPPPVGLSRESPYPSCHTLGTADGGVAV